MASTYSALKIELITTGEQTGTWGGTTNTNLGTALEEAIVGRAEASFTTDANLTISLTNSNGTQVARHYVLNATSVGSLTATRDLIVPSIDKPYIVENNTTGGQSIRVKTTAGTGITIPNGKTAMVYADSTNVVSAVSYIPAATIDTATIAAGTATLSSATITGGALTGTTISGSTGSFTTLAASSTVSGAGFSAYLASPPAIGGTVAAAGSFTTLATSGAATLSSTLGVTGAATLSSTLGVTGATTLSSTLGVTGASTFTGAVTLTGGLNTALAVLQGGTGVTTSTGTGANVLGTSPTLATPTFDSAQLVTISGTAPLYMVRAWARGTSSTIAAAGNVGSVTRNSAGNYSLNFTTAMSNTTYACVWTCATTAGSGGYLVITYSTTLTTSYAQIVMRPSAGTGGDVDVGWAASIIG